MKRKKKRHAKQLLHKSLSRRWQHAYLRFISRCKSALNSPPNLVLASKKSIFTSKDKLLAVSLILLMQFACVTTPNTDSTKVSYLNPPKIGSWLQAQRDLVACDTVSAARYMAEFGFFHPQCTQLIAISSREYQVQSRSKVQLREGPMWLLLVQRQQSTYWVPIPWHDWL